MKAELTVLLAGIILTSFAGALVTLLLFASDRLSLRLRAVLDILSGGVAVRATSELGVGSTFELVLRRASTVGGDRMERRSRRDRRTQSERRSGDDRRVEGQ